MTRMTLMARMKEKEKKGSRNGATNAKKQGIVLQ
jgi:hypothetical protein